MTPLIASMIKRTPDADRYMWFDIGTLGGEVVEMDGSDPIASRIPYPRCAVCLIEDGDPGCIYIEQRDNGLQVTGGLCVIAGIERPLSPVGLLFAPEQGYYIDDDKPAAKEVARQILVTIADWMRSMEPGCNAYAITAKASHINRKRAAKGKGPIAYDWHTVTISPRATPNVAIATPDVAHHASPRAHDRRGHWRTYPSGKRGWVKDCKVGDASKGAIFKDYRIKGKS